MSVDWAHLLLLVMFGLIWLCVFQLAGRTDGRSTRTARRNTGSRRPLGKL
ncbi:MAG: hypothetical protein JNK57_04610 [Planctomycetaceae bacterium]|nr:hypothetical protein [Planctomycetaceae bacterium]